MRRGVVVGNAHVEQLFEFRQRDEQGDGHGAALFAKGVIWAAASSACDFARHAVGQCAEEALDEGSRRGLADRPSLKAASDESTYGLKCVLSQMRGSVVDLENIPAGVVQLR